MEKKEVADLQCNRRCERIPVLSGISCKANGEVVTIEDLTADGMFIVTKLVGLGTHDIVNLAIKQQGKRAFTVRGRVMHVTRRGLGIKIDQSATSIGDLDSFQILLKRCKGAC